MLFSLSSWPSDGEPSLFRGFTADLNPTVLGVLESFANKNRKSKIHIYVHILCSAAALLSSVKLLCLDTAGYAAPLPSERLVLGSCSSGKVSLGKKKKNIRQKYCHRTENLSPITVSARIRKIVLVDYPEIENTEKATLYWI